MIIVFYELFFKKHIYIHETTNNYVRLQQNKDPNMDGLKKT